MASRVALQRSELLVAVFVQRIKVCIAMLNTEIMPDLGHELERSLSCGLNPNQTPLMAERGTPAIAPSAPAMLFF